MTKHFRFSKRTRHIYSGKEERDIFEFTEIWHSRKKSHSASDYKTIEEYWKQ